VALRGRKPLIIVGATVAGLAIASMLLRALSKVMSGHGIDTYRNYKGALLNYAGAVVTALVFLLCIVVAYGMKWWHHRQERKYEEILRARAAANTEARESARTDS
jgi:formate hydrogenlyase subunit 3/multisubunit Na+/H+ antiporter MnhD subunit